MQPFRHGGHAELPPPIEDSYKHITNKQINYIQILSDNLNLTIASRNNHIIGIIKHTFNGDIHLLSCEEGSKIIDTFKKWVMDQK